MTLRALHPDQFTAAATLFAGYAFDRPVIESVLERRQAGAVLLDGDGPGAILLHQTGDAYVVGPAADAHARRLLRDGPRELGLVPHALNWVCCEPLWADQVRRIWGPLATEAPRLWFHHVDPHGTRASEAMRNLPQDFELRPMDVSLARQCRGKVYDEIEAGWGSIERFVADGLGLAVVERGPHPGLAAVCASYAIGGGAAEITITTLEPFRGRGLARAAGGAFILECLRRGLRPAWTCRRDNAPSIRLAKRLGFEPAGDYVQFYIQP
ncbi:MAG: GNAT family N-acetyltransferase [Phycisphaeraceae bacterium]|nr:GNAT family N-acetyltransferase [Phycisphaeraceae bacterium]